MGSSQSTPTMETRTDHGPASHASQAKEETNKPKRTGIDLVNHKCRKKKANYDKCVSKWYSERFLSGKSINQEEECGDFFEIYRQCYLKNLKRELFDKGNKQVKEGSLLAEELGRD